MGHPPNHHILGFTSIVYIVVNDTIRKGVCEMLFGKRKSVVTAANPGTMTVTAVENPLSTEDLLS
jgi:hypothetical protein